MTSLTNFYLLHMMYYERISCLLCMLKISFVTPAPASVFGAAADSARLAACSLAVSGVKALGSRRRRLMCLLGDVPVPTAERLHRCIEDATVVAEMYVSTGQKLRQYMCATG